MKRLFSKSLRVGLDLSSARIQAVGLRHKGKAFALEFLEIVDLIKEYALGSADEITDDHTIELLRKLAAKHNLKGTRISAVLPASSAVIQVLQVSASQTEAELLEKIRYELKQLTSESLDKMQITCQELDNNKREDDKIPLLVCAVPNEVIKRYKRIISSAGLKLTVLDLDALAVYNAFYYFSKMKLGPTIIVQVSGQYSICLIILPGGNPFFHVIKLGTEHIENQTADTISPRVEPSVPAGDVSQWADLSFFQNSSPPPDQSNAFEKLSSEVRKCIRHIQSHEGISNFDKIYLSGGGRVLTDLAETFEKTFGLKTKIWNPVLQFASDGDLGFTRNQLASGIYLTPAIGTAVRGN